VHNKMVRGLAVNEAEALAMIAAPSAFANESVAVLPARSSDEYHGPAEVQILQEESDPAAAGRL
jgi:hypothetical protein